MVKFLLACFILLASLNADEGLSSNPLEEKILNLIGEDKYMRNKEYIDILFTPSTQFYKQEHLDSVKVMQTLVENQLFSTKLPYKRELKIALKTDGSPSLFVKLMKDSLRNLGYYRYNTLSSDFDGTTFVWKISFQSSMIPDIVKIQEQLNKVGSSVVDIEKITEDEWSYSVDISHSTLESIKVYSGEKVVLKHSLDPYWIDVRDIKKITVGSSRRNSWYPQIALFDMNLKLLKVIKKDQRTKVMTLELPQNAIYMKLADIYTMKNIRDSLTLYPKRAR